MKNKRSTSNIDKLMACPECDLLIERVHVPEGFISQCPRCHFILEHPTHLSIRNDAICVFIGLVVYFPAMLLPVISLTMLDETVYFSLLSCVLTLLDTGNIIIALTLVLTLFVIPLLQMILLIFITIRLHYKAHSAYLALSFKCYNALSVWAMLDIFMLSLMVSAIKLRDDASLKVELGLYALVILLITNILQAQLLNKPLIWRSIERHGKS